MFHRGQEVVCVDDDPWDDDKPEDIARDVVRKGSVYIVERVLPCTLGARCRCLKLDFLPVGLRLKDVPQVRGEAYCSMCFRPVVKRGTDAQVEKLKRLVLSPPVEVKVKKKETV